LTVLEADRRWGGKILTQRVNGFVIEGGPDTFLATKPWAVALCRELGLEGRLHGTNPQQKNTYVVHHGQLQPLPDGLTMMIPTRMAPMLRSGLLSWVQKARMGLDLILPPRPGEGDESLGGFVTRRLGRAAYERLIEPLLSGIYAGDGDRLSLQATFPHLRQLEQTYGSLIRAALALRRQSSNNGHARSAFLTPTSGLAEIVEALIAALTQAGADLRLNCPISRLNFSDGVYHISPERGNPLHAHALILATPAFVAGALLSEIDASLAADLQAIPYASTATISLAYRQEDLPRPLDGYGYVIPRSEGRHALACTWTSTKFPHRAPPGHALLRVFVGRSGQEEEIPWDEASLVQLARQELRLTLGITASPLLQRVFIWKKAMPQYNLGHPERLARIRAAVQKWPGLALAGNAYGGIGLPDCIHSGEIAAESVL
jgi:oxygen-dependent protoporphyrinogen oxidase